MEIDSHSYSHANLTEISDEQLKREIYDTKEYLENLLNINSRVFCYPYGKTNYRVIEELKKYGYEAALTTLYGRADINQDRFYLKRIKITYDDDIQSFSNKISG